MPTAPQIDAPLSLGGFFPDSDDENNDGQSAELDQCFEIQVVNLQGVTLRVRQFAFHTHNANRVWPGTFNLAEYLLRKDSSGKYIKDWGKVLELGTATGLLAIRLALSSRFHAKRKSDHLQNGFCCSEIVTSDVEDDQVEDCVRYNFSLNGFSGESDDLLCPHHVPHTWGTGWKASTEKANVKIHFDTIVASDILLYISSYPALVQSLREILDEEDMGNTKRFVMSWNRRMKEAKEFFDRMEKAGFSHKHEGKCVYTFQKRIDEQKCQS